ncbi:inosine/guanosine kinase, partial [Vibrio parahaemolyticus]
MKFPGQRKSKHYFPVHARDPLVSQAQESKKMTRTHIIGIDQTLVDIEAKVTSDVIEKYGLSKGHSLVIDDVKAEELYQQLKEENLITNEYA